MLHPVSPQNIAGSRLGMAKAESSENVPWHEPSNPNPRIVDALMNEVDALKKELARSRDAVTKVHEREKLLRDR